MKREKSFLYSTRRWQRRIPLLPVTNVLLGSESDANELSLERDA